MASSDTLLALRFLRLGSILYLVVHACSGLGHRAATQGGVAPMFFIVLRVVA